LASDDIPSFGTIDLDLCDNEEAFTQADSVLFGGNVATRRAGAVAIKRFESGRQMNFIFQNSTIIDNFAADTSEAAVEVALTSQPPKSRARSFFKDCLFRNRGVQLKGISRGTPVKNFYDIQRHSSLIVSVPERVFARRIEPAASRVHFRHPVVSQALVCAEA
jgi:hypothetical protein